MLLCIRKGGVHRISALSAALGSSLSTSLIGVADCFCTTVCTVMRG